MGRFITMPIDRPNASAKPMAGLDFSSPCNLVSTDELGELSAGPNTMAEDLQQALARLKDANTLPEKDVEKERILLAGRRKLVDSPSHQRMGGTDITPKLKTVCVVVGTGCFSRPTLFRAP